MLPSKIATSPAARRKRPAQVVPFWLTFAQDAKKAKVPLHRCDCLMILRGIGSWMPYGSLDSWNNAEWTN